MLGALALDDIGMLFPNTDPKYKDIDSVKLLEHTFQLVKSKGHEIGNIVSNIIAQAPKMMSYISKMKHQLAEILQIPFENLSIKAKTKESLDSVGQKLAIEANAVVLLVPINS